VYSSAVVPETESQVGDANESAQGVSRSSDHKCSPARPLPTMYAVSVSTSAVAKVSLVVSFMPIIVGDGDLARRDAVGIPEVLHGLGSSAAPSRSSPLGHLERDPPGTHRGCARRNSHTSTSTSAGNRA
jgi:hypothetical protein